MTDSGDDDIPAAEGWDLSADDRGRTRGTAPRAGRASPPAAEDSPPGRGWRALVAALLIVVGCVLAPLSVVAVWTASQVSDTSRYVANMEPLIKDPAIQNALTDKITNQIVTRINVAGLTDPDRPAGGRTRTAQRCGSAR